MGLVKHQMMEDEHRGHYSIEKYVCADCVDDHYLKLVIQGNAEAETCDYCGQEFDESVAAPVDVVIALVYEAFRYYFSEPTDAGVPYDSSEGGFLLRPVSTNDALQTLPLECHDELFEDIEGSFTNDHWVATANGSWMESHTHEIMSTAWHIFVSTVKHENRYFFGVGDANVEYHQEDLSPLSLLEEIEKYVAALGFTTTIKSGTSIYRVREFLPNENWEPDEENLTAPPSELARAGRMNPAGISYFYGALQSSTAISEIVKGPPSILYVGRFQLNTDLFVVDLSRIEQLPSIFDMDARERREKMIFLYDFFQDIAKPIAKDGREHIDYVPSQIVCEYFAKVATFESAEKKPAGLLYPSAVHPGGINLVIFPNPRSFDKTFKELDFVDYEELRLDTWNDIKQVI